LPNLREYTFAYFYYRLEYDQRSVGNLRFQLPQPIPAYSGTIDATSYGPTCPQQKFTLPILQGLPAEIVDDIVNKAFTALFPDDEDCEIFFVILVTLPSVMNSGLTLNVVKPASATPSSKLPVVAVSTMVLCDVCW